MQQLISTTKASPLNLKLQAAIRRASDVSFKETALVNYSGKPKRPRSNLLKDSGFKLLQKDISSFVAFTKMKLRAFRDEQMWAAVMAEVVYPEFTPAKNLGATKNLRKNFINVLAISYTKAACSAQVSVKKNSNGFTIKIPVLAALVDPENKLFGFKTALVSILAGGDEDQLEKFTANPIKPTEGVSTNGIQGKYLTADVARIFRALNANLTFKTTALAEIMTLEFEVNRAQAEYLTQSKWDDLRPIDMYGLVRTWANARRDAQIVPPQYTRPLADIAATIPAGGEPRTNELGIVVDQDATLYYLPKELNNIQVYDNLMAMTLTGDDGTLSQIQGDAIRPLPPSQPVFLDWVNGKWSYVTDSGNLRVQDISRAIPANISHVKTFLATKITDPVVQNFLTKVAALATANGVTLGIGAKEAIMSLPTALNQFEEYEGTTLADCQLHHVFYAAKMSDSVPTPRLPAFDYFKTLVTQAIPSAKKFVEQKTDEAYKLYSVTGISTLAAELIICEKYGSDYEGVYNQDRQYRAKYLAPKVDPNYKIPALPFIAKDRGFMPHQVKASNALRDSPDNAILAVDAGGGKTPLGVIDVLKEMQMGLNGPFLIMCPSHLVPQYVIEFAYFTEGRVNCVPVTTYTIKRNGFDGLEAMIDVAPVNTVVLCDYNLAKGSSKTKAVGYGTAATKVYAVVDFLRQFRFNYILCDEAHLLKNLGAAQSKAVGQLAADIKKKRLASGTFIANSESDVASLFSYLDPTVFGTKENFIREFSAGSGTKITSLRPGAELEIKQRMQQNCSYVQIKRKEWAAILPPRVESFNNIVELSPNQRKVYDMILAKTKEELLQAAKSNEKLAMILGISNSSEEELDDMDAESSALMEGGIDELLKPYLSRLEKFLCSPGSDPLGNLELQGTDRISPKVAKFAEICRKHLAEGIPGKILAFTNQVDSALGIYDNLPEDIKKKTLLYAAADKEACGATFENDDNYQIMIGVGTSMEVGLNLQFCSRLIRIETVMSPAALEQGNSRIGRPNVKKAETRPATYYDWLTVDRSIDMTKIAYLLTKKVRIACVEEADNPLYSELTQNMPELFRLSLDNIAINNSRDTLSDYLNPQTGMYRKYLEAVAADYEEFRKRNPEYLTPDGKLKMTPLERSADLDGSKIMRRVPYVPGLQLYKARDLGLIRIDDYLRDEISNTEDDEADDNMPIDATDVLPSNDPDEVKAAKYREALIGQPVHTEFGEGEITSVAYKGKIVTVRLYDGKKVRLKMLAVFIVTKPQTSGKDVRNSLAKAAGSIPLDTPMDVKSPTRVVPVKNITKGEKPAKVEPKAKQTSVSLRLVVSNDYLGLELNDADENKEAAKTLRLMKFEDLPPHFFALIKTPQHLDRVIRMADKIGLSPATNAIALNLQGFADAWATMGSKAKSMFTLPTQVGLRNFYLLNHRPNPSRKEYSAYISVEGEDVYLCLPSTGNPGNRVFTTKVIVPAVKFYPAAPQLIRYFKTPAQLVAFIKQVVNAGIEIVNEGELHAQIKSLYQQVRKVTKTEPDAWFIENKPR